MAKKTWSYTMTVAEQRLWNAEEMAGWRKAFEACTEDDARDEGRKKYIIRDRAGSIVATDEVAPLPVTEEVY